jgi:hypothetical protein
MKPHRDAQRQERRADQRKREKAGGRTRRERDDGYLAWLHEGLPCIACLVLGAPIPIANPIEAAHQKIQAADRGVHRRLGVRPSDIWCVPLCVSHHREGPICCDPAQRKFWAVVGLEPEDVVDFCRDLHGAYLAERDGEAVVRDYASLAAGQRSAA